MGDLETSYPPKCPKCKAAISKDSFERQLSTEQQNTFRTHAARTALKPGERLIECKECGLYEVTKDDPVLWWCPHCGCGMCRVCNKDEDLPPNAFKFDIEKSQHQVCATLREPKALIENAIEEGSKMRCPACNLAGRKDDAVSQQQLICMPHITNLLTLFSCLLHIVYSHELHQVHDNVVLRVWTFGKEC